MLDGLQSILNSVNVLPKSAKQNLIAILKEKYYGNEDFVERLSEQVKTKRDYEELFRLILSVYESGFIDAINQQKEALQKNGYVVTVKTQEVDVPQGEKIFNR